MSKYFKLLSQVAVLQILMVFASGNVYAATGNDVINLELAVNPSISISAPSNVSLGTITGTGSSSEGSASWTISTNNSAGYKLEWTASSATMSNGSDTIAAYTPTVADTPETWSVASSVSEWGGRLKSSSTDTDVEWGTDTTSEKWLNVATTARELVSRASATASSTQTIAFKAEIGSSKIQQEGTYTVDITVTATSL